MTNRIITSIAISLPTLYLVLARAASAQGTACKTGEFCNPLSFPDICSLLVGILNAFMIIAAPIAVVFIIIAGAKFVLARGKADGPSGLTAAKNNLLWTLVGIAIFFGAIVIMQVIVTTVSGFLAGNSQTPLQCTLK
jgi:hypothetical protein